MTIIRKLYRRISWKDPVVIGIVLASIPILIYFLIATQTRYLADDFCMAQTLSDFGYIDSQFWWFRNWSGRYSYFLLVHGLVFLGPYIVQAWIILLTLLLIFSFYGIAKEVSKSFFTLRLRKLEALFIALLSTVFLITSLPSVNQTFFWMSGSITYILPIALFNLVVVLMLQRRNPWLVALLTLFAAGLSETMTLSVLLIFSVLTILAYKFRKDISFDLKVYSPVISALLLACVILFLSPGNHLREQALLEQGYSIDPGVKYIITRTGLDTLSYVSSFLSTNQPTIIATFLLGLLGGTRLKGIVRARVLPFLTVMPLFLSLCVVFIMFISEYATSSTIPDRSLAIPNYFMLLAILLSGALSASARALSLKAALSIKTTLWCLFWIFTFFSFTNALSSSFPLFRDKVLEDYADKWDEQYIYDKDHRLKASDRPPLGFSYGLADITPENREQTCANFYNLR